VRLLHRFSCALLAAAAAGCGEPPAQRVLYDLVALAPEAERQPPEGPAGNQLIAIELDDHRDGFAPVRCPAGHTLIFRDLRTGGPARVELAFGSVQPAGQRPAGEPVSFRVEAWRAPHGVDDPPDATLERKVALPEVPDAGLHASLPLDADGEARFTLRLSTSAEGTATWPAFLSPRVVGVPAAAPRAVVAVEELVDDLLARLDGATVVLQSPDVPVARGVLDSHVGLAGGRRAAVVAAAPARVRWSITPPAGSSLRFAVGVDAAAGWQLGGDGVTCAVEIDGARVWERRLDPHTLARDRGWKAERLDLSPWVGSEVALELVSEPGATAEADLVGFARPAVVRAREVPRLAAGEAPTVVLLVVDTLRADRFGGATMPRLQALATRGLRFRSARSVSSWTWPATASLLTGRPPNEHGVHDGERSLLPDGLATLAELFAARGYVTGAFVANSLVAADNGFDQGFATFVCAPNVTARALVERVAAWLDATEGAARLLYVHVLDPHVPYEPPAAFAAAWPADLPRTPEELAAAPLDADAQRRMLDALRASYDAEVRYADEALAELLDTLQARGALHDAIVLVTADHGEEFREHGGMAHGPHLYEETLAVPLVVVGFGPHALPPAVRDEPVDLQDVLPTLLDLAGVPGPDEPLPGRSLRAPAPPAPFFAQTFQGLEPGVDGFTQKLSVIADGWKLILTPASGRTELFDLRADPGETRNLAAREPARLEALRALLVDWEARTRARAPDNAAAPDEVTFERLRELGYLGR